MFDAKVFRKRLDIARAHKGWSQERLAKELKMRPTTVSHWVTGKHPPEVASLLALARLFKRPVGWFLGDGAEDMNGSTETPRLSPLPERAITPVNRRNEIPPFRIVKRKKGAVALPKWLDLACGEGCDLARCEDLIYFEGLDNFKGLHTAEVRGESMEDTLHAGDIVVLRPFPPDAILKKLSSPAERTPMDVFRAKFDIREGDVVVVTIRDRTPTLKRVHYDTSRGERHWKLQIRADNPASGFEMFQVDDEDWIAFHAKVIGRGVEDE